MRHILKSVLICLLIFGLAFFGPMVRQIEAASPETFNASGTFTASTGIYAVTGECRGGGAGGSNNGSVAARPGGGGGGGAYALTNSIAVTPGTGYAVTVGPAVGAETNGNNSSFTGDSAQTVVAAGGSTTTTRTGGAGGTTAASTGNTLWAGGVGGTAANSNNNGGGGGGEGGRSTATGGAGQPNSGATGGAGGTGGDGGDGGPGGNNNAAGVIGTAPGGGGGGAGGNNNTGGGGAAGQCIISYTDTWAPSTVLATYSPAWTFAAIPANDSSSQISMTATTGYDYTTPINYLFTLDNSGCGASAGTGGTSSSWQSSATYSDSGLDANKCYGYTVTARDSMGTPNTGTASSVSSTYTSANIPGTPTLGSATLSTLNLTNAENGNPTANPVTYFAVQVVTTSPTDSTWLNQWVNATGDPSATAVWMTDAALDALVIRGLASGTTYGVRIKARNQDNDETVLSAEGQGSTRGILSADIVDAGGNSVSSPTMAMSATSFSFSYQTSTGTFGVSDQKIRMSNTDTNPQWNVTLAAGGGPTALWSAGTPKYDFNDPTALAVDGSDPDNYGGQMTVNASGGTLTPQSGCTNTGLTLGSSGSFSEGVTDSVTLVTAGATASTRCYWDLTGVSVSQTIPKEQPAGSYSINFTVTITAI